MGRERDRSGGAARDDEPLPESERNPLRVRPYRRDLALVGDEKIDLFQKFEVERQRRRKVEQSASSARPRSPNLTESLSYRLYIMRGKTMSHGGCKTWS